MKLFSLFCLLLIIWVSPIFAGDIVVGLEPFPPLITEDTRGYSIDLLREIEKISDLKFTIKIMPYNRAKAELEKKQLDLIGHTPHGMEEARFYNYAEELAWSIPSSAGIFVMNKKYFNLKLVANHRIGTPFGNAGFHAAVLGIPREKFIESRLDNLVTMLEYSRIDALLFERVTTINTIQKLKVTNIYCQTDKSMSNSFAVTKDDKGLKLKHRLDALIKQVDQQKIFKHYFQAIKTPINGIVPISE